MSEKDNVQYTSCHAPCLTPCLAPRIPLKVLPERVRRTYRGGKCLDLWHGNTDGVDGNMPEKWLVSMTEASNPGFPPVAQEGLSRVCMNGKQFLMRDLVEAAPETMLGERHYKKYGATLGVLAKLLDPVERLSIQVHPDKAFARIYFHSEYGKTECWHVVEAREIEGRSPYILMGFRPGVTKEMWEHMYREQDIDGMVESLTYIVPKPGETYIVPGGLPHAIGPGCHMIEIQEPTDYTMRTERTTADGKQIPDALIHQGLGEKLLLDCFHYETMDEEEIKKNYRIPPKEITYENGSRYSLLVGPETTSCFAMDKTEIHGSLTFKKEENFTILIVLSGKGVLVCGDEQQSIRMGDQFFIPAGAGEYTITGGMKPGRETDKETKKGTQKETCEETCTVIRFYPPDGKPIAPVMT